MSSIFHDKFYSDNIKLTYDDVLLYPEYSSVRSRVDTDLSCQLGHLRLKYPVMSAAMDTVTGGQMAKVMSDIGGIGVVHRFQTVQERIGCCKDSTIVACAVGLDETDQELKDIAAVCNIIAIDVAHAYAAAVVERTNYISNLLGDNISIMVGNIVSPFAVKPLVDAGADILKVGIGGGSACSTRDVTGFGYPNLSAILDVRKKLEEHQFGKLISIVADGGIRNSSDIAKAIAAGADAVMLGRLLAGCNESPGERIGSGKVYRGMASNAAQNDWKGGLKKGTVAEGIDGVIPVEGFAGEKIEKLMGGLRSAFSYADAHTLEEFQQNTQFVKVTSNCINESKTRIFK